MACGGKLTVQLYFLKGPEGALNVDRDFPNREIGAGTAMLIV